MSKVHKIGILGWRDYLPSAIEFMDQTATKGSAFRGLILAKKR